MTIFLVLAASAFSPGAPLQSLRIPTHSLHTPLRNHEVTPVALLDFLGGKKKPKREESALTTGLDQLLRDAPLPMKLAAGMLRPLVGALEGAMRESAADADDLLYEAGRRLQMEPMTKGLSLGRVFSTGSSTSTINGVTQKQITLQCDVIGPTGIPQGNALVQGGTLADGKLGITGLRVQLRDGRVVDVGAGGRGSGRGGVDDVIDVDVL
eukprot:CAMPEP_0184377766 /NCGR_PEP_ID=MMETSP0007-20130409/2536_1 /TAXON_ID=97485 /ORGANISM="Prymnesium parvum, Strain Texoma1" /LENGTH=209 /DNA_ID=CAMNT_0026721789 /DNA_START=34 /DNA_END=663 /DNA_ORIENTATION=-